MGIFVRNALMCSMLAALVLTTISGCKDGRKVVGDDFPEPLERCAVALFREGSTTRTAGDAIKFGAGFFATIAVGVERKYFIVTPRHVTELLFGYDFVDLQLGVKSARSVSAIMRLRVPGVNSSWPVCENYYDVSLCDITSAMKELMKFSVDPAFVDLDAVGLPPSSPVSPLILGGVGVATSNDYIRLGISADSPGICLAATARDSVRIDKDTLDWTSPFERRDAELSTIYMKKAHTFINHPIAGFTTIHRVHEMKMSVTNGDSGAPVFLKGTDGRTYLLGMTIGVDEGRGVANVVPADLIVEFARRAYGNRQATEVADNSAMQSDTPIRSIEFSGSESNLCGEETQKDYRLEIWHPGEKRIKITLSGECTDRNSCKALFGIDYGDTPPITGEDVYLEFGWDNTTSDGRRASPGHKEASVEFTLDENGNMVDAKTYGDTFASRECVLSNKNLIYDHRWNFVRLIAKGPDPANGRIKFEAWK